MNKILTHLILTLMAVQVQAQTQPEAPKLVVGITLDQLRGDYLQMMGDLFGEEGFNYLLKEGQVYHQVDYNYPGVDRASAVATVNTGAYPTQHQIVSNLIYNQVKDKSTPILIDANELGNYTTSTLSPRAIATSTITDELAVATYGASRIYSVAPDADVAIITAGHAGDAAIWFDENTGRWATSTYYREVPKALTEFNTLRSIDKHLDTVVWQPSLPIERYIAFPYDIPDYTFAHKLKGKSKYKEFKETPLINTQITDLATAIINEKSLGQRSVSDYINIAYYCGTYNNKGSKEYSTEIQDAYVRLDQELASLISTIKQKVGLENTLIYLIGTGYTNTESAPLAVYQIPTGVFYPEKSTALLNYYLMAVYGHNKWVLGYNNQQIYLNRELIKEQNINYSEILETCADFLIDMEGVQDVITAIQIERGATPQGVLRRKTYVKKLSGDIALEIKSGWSIETEDKEESAQYQHHNAVQTPFLIIGSGIEPREVFTPIEAVHIAPTISKSLQIRAPNAAVQHPLNLNN